MKVSGGAEEASRAPLVEKPSDAVCSAAEKSGSLDERQDGHLVTIPQSPKAAHMNKSNIGLYR
jgi:hypothetical protein